MSFDFGPSTSAGSDPTADFESKFPDLDAGDADAALTAATTGAPGATGAAPPSLDDFENDLLGGGASNSSPPPQITRTDSSVPAIEESADDRQQFETQFPELDDPDLDVGGAGGSHSVIEAQPTSFASPSSNGFMAPPMSGSGQLPPRGPSPGAGGGYSTSFDPAAAGDDDGDEPEPVREWRHKQADDIARRDAEGERKKQEAISQAERDIDSFYAEYNAKKEKNIKKNKEDEAAFTEKRTRELAEGTTWDRITKLIDLQNSQSKTIAPGGPGSTDLARFKEMLLSLRREGETAPAAGGY